MRRGETAFYLFPLRTRRGKSAKCQIFPAAYSSILTDYTIYTMMNLPTGIYQLPIMAGLSPERSAAHHAGTIAL